MASMWHTILAVLLVSWPTLVTPIAAEPAEKLPAFPGAEGFGATTIGGRGGRVIEVTNLNDAGLGSFRSACDAEGPRIVVFRTGGTIYVKKRIELRHPNITIAGQTAPGGGICLSIEPKTADGGPLKVMTSEVIIRHVRFRPGPPLRAEFAENVDGLTIANRNGPIRNVIIDHCSFSWSTDELFNTWYDVKDVTVQWCLFSEALSKSKHNKGNHSKGPLLGSIAGDRQSYHHNLMVHNVGRNPMIKLNGLADVVNNVAHVPRVVAMSISDQYGPARANFIGNYVTAPNGDGLVHGCIFLPFGKGIAVYAQGNIGPHLKDVDGKQSLWFRNIKGDFFATKRHPAPRVTTHTAKEARQLVLKHAGATRPKRDAVDTRVVDDVKAGRTRIVDHPKDVGGWPELAIGSARRDSDHDGMPHKWEKTHGLDPNDPSDGPQTATNGYTNLENYLNKLAGDPVNDG